MKTNHWLLLLGFTPFLLQAQNNNSYPSKSGKLVYSVEFGDVVSTYTLLFDDFGQKECIDIVGLNAGNSDHTRTITNSEGSFVINYDEKQIIKFPAEPSDEAYNELSGTGNSEINFRQMEGNNSNQKSLGTENVLGKQCQVFEVTEKEGNKGKYWFWNGFIVKAEYLNEEGEHIFLKAKEINFDITVNSNEFNLPSGFEITDMTETMEQMKKLQQMYGVPDEE